MWNFSQWIGAVESKLIPTVPPRNSGSTCCNYRGNIILLLFAVADAHDTIHAAVFVKNITS
jgi:hypothetical protein